MKFRVSVLPQARRDIDRNADWWAEHYSVELALKWSDAVYDQLESLANFPERNGLSAENGEFPYEIRDKLVGIGARSSFEPSSQSRMKRYTCWPFVAVPKTHSGGGKSSPRRPADSADS